MKVPDINSSLNEKDLAGFRSLFEKNIDLEEEEWELISNNLTYHTAGRNAVLLHTGEVEKTGRLIVKGIIKVTVHEQNTDPYVFDFRKAGDYLCDVVSFIQKSKSSFTFKTLTPCEWLEINLSDLTTMNETTFILFNRIILGQLKRGYDRTAFFRISPGEERYMLFCKQYPEIVKQVKLGEIASYLNITPQSLSRIRKNWIR